MTIADPDGKVNGFGEGWFVITTKEGSMKRHLKNEER